MTREGVSRLVSILAEEYGATFSSDRSAMWEAGLRDLTDEQGFSALARLVATSQYPNPKLADLRRMIDGDPLEALEALAARAEQHLQTHLCDHKFNNFWPLLNAVVRDMGGVDAVIALLDGGQWRFERARFKALLAHHSRGSISLEAGAALVPQRLASSLLTFPVEQYAAQGLPVPIVDAPFLPTPPTQPALPRGEVIA